MADPVPPTPPTDPAVVEGQHAESQQSGPRPPGFRGGPPQVGKPGPRGDRPFPRGERPKVDGSKPPQLDKKDFAAAKPNTRELDRAIEDELAAAMAGFDVSGTVAKAETRTRQQAIVPGQSARKRGVIVGVHGKDVFVEVPGGRSQGVLPIQQFEGKAPQVGDPVEFDIERYDPANGLLVLTMTGAAQVVTDWSSVAPGMVVEAKVTGTNQNKTGLLVEVNGIKGFMPASQVDLYRTENIEALVNQRLKCVVTEVDPAERNLLVSRRTLLEREREVQREQFWAAVEEGQTREGIVRSVREFGAFVDLGGADGLIPVSELSWNRVGHPSEVVSVGQKVEVVVRKVDRDARKVSLSLRALVRSPWADFAQANKVGSRVIGKVTRLMDFGAFVEVAPGIEGLIHISELSTQRTRRVRDVVQEGQNAEVEILSMDIENRRMSLSLKAIKAEAEAKEEAEKLAEEEADKKAALERLAQRFANPNLRGGIGGSNVRFDQG